MNGIPTTAGAVREIIGLTWKRVLRGRLLWVAAVIGVVPVLFGALLTLGGRHRGLADELLMLQMLVLAVLPPMFIAGSIGEEIEDRTITYLWSRPIPRWAVLVGKLLALAPIAMVLVVTSWQIACALVLDSMPSVRSHAALAGAALVVSAIATGIAVLVPRYGMTLTIGYMLADFWIGIIPRSIHNFSVLHHVTSISFPSPEGGDPAAAVIWLAAIGAGWLGLGLWRIRRLEA